MADSEAENLDDGAAWRAAGNKQVYRYPEDMEGPDKRSDPRCHKCGKTSYKAETVTYERIPFHKNCFKCLACKKKLTPGAANPFGEESFLCNPHFQQAVKRGSRVADSEVVSAASANVVSKGPSLITSDGKEEEVDMSAGTAWRKAGIKQSYNYSEDITGATARADPRCNKCGKTSYKAETVTYERIPYHKNCFKCVQCKKKMNPGEANPFGPAEFLCNPHFKQSILGRGSVGGDVFSAMSPDARATGPSLVTGASKNEFSLDEGIAWRKAGVKQAYKYAEDMDGSTKRSDPRCNKCGKTSYKAETITYERIPYHKNCFKCVQCKKKLTAGDANPFGEDGYLCNAHYHQIVLGGGGAIDSDSVVSASTQESVATGPSLITSATSGGVNPKIQDGIKWRTAGIKQAYRYPEDMEGKADPRCQFCGKTAYKAEVVTYERIPYHKNCFKCIQCKKRLTAGAANPFGEDAFLCNAHFMQFALQRSGASGDSDVASASSASVDDVGPATVGGALPKKKKTTYKPPARKRGGRR